MTLRDLSPDEFAHLSALMDELLDRPAHERSRWVEALAGRDPRTAGLLRTLVANENAGPDGFAEAREAIERRLRRGVADPDLEGALFGPWRVLRPLGRGGMGTVWLAMRADGLFRRRVALKLLRQHLPPSAADRFAREREILGALDHPGIARLLDAGFAADGRPYLALEYVEGETLTAWCDARRVPVRDRIALFLQVARAVAYAHANLVIHRDLKPSNILVTPEGQARLLDFGIAKLVPGEGAEIDGLTEIAGPAFTPDYAAPEQIAGAAVTTATDVYALGVVLHELLSGTRPYRLSRRTRAALEEAILAADPLLPSASAFDATIAATRSNTVRGLRRELAGDLDTIIAKALRKEPETRYATADALALDLERYSRGEPVLARAPGSTYQLRKFIGRHRLGVVAGTIAAAALLAGSAVSLWQAGVAREQALRAEREATKARVVQGFLLDLFRANSVEQPDPLRAQQTTARELLDLGAKRAGAGLAGSPEAQAEVLGTLAGLYYQLGLTDEAAERQRASLAAARGAYAGDDPRLAEALMAYADAIVDSSRRDELLPTLDEARTVLDEAGDMSLARGRLLALYAKAHSYTSVQQTRRYADEALAFYRRHHPGAREVQGAIQAAATARWNSGDPAGAEALYREALEQTRRAGGGPSAAQVIPLVGIAQQRWALGDIEEAERNYRAALDAARAVYGERHGETLQCEAKLGRFLHATARREEGRRWLDSAGAKAAPGRDGVPAFVVAVVAAVRGAAWLAEGRVDDAEPLIALDVADARANYPGSAPLATALLAQGMLWNAQGRYADALAVLEEAIAIAERVSPGGDPARLNRYLLEIAAVLVASGQPARAHEVLARIALPAYAARMPLAIHDVQGRIVRADVWLAQGRADRAEQESREALALVERAPTRRFHALVEADAALRLGQSLAAKGDARAARPWLERAVDLRAALDVPTSPWLGRARRALARCLQDAGDPVRALEEERRAAAALRAHARLGPHFGEVAASARR